MLITPERKVPQRSDASQNDHKSKGYPAKTSAAAFTMQVGYRRLYPTFASGFLLDFLKSGSTVLVLCETFGEGESAQMCFFPIFPKTCFGRQTEKVVMWSDDLSLG